MCNRRAAWADSFSIAGPLMPQCVINSGPEAFSFVPVMLAVACFTTVPVSPVMLSPGRHRLNSDGTGATVSTPVGASMAMPAAFGLPPLATSTMSACRGASPSAAKLMPNRVQPCISRWRRQG